jgi:propanol-preferring alcohol dehydrogenase
MSRQMQAAQVLQFGQALVLRELDVPMPGPGQILVKTEACGVCHTDLHAAGGDWPLKPALPFTPGHEGIGIVTALGAGVTAVKEGDRVGVPWLHSACGHCEFCLAAQEPVCAEAQSVATPGMAALPNSSSPTRTTSPTFRPAWPHAMRRP